MTATVTARGPLSAGPAAGPCRVHHALRRLGGGHPRDPPGARVRETVAQAAGQDEWPSRRAAGGKLCRGTARPADSTLSIPETKARGGTLAIRHVFLQGPFSERCSGTRSPGLRSPTPCSGWVAVARRLPAWVPRWAGSRSRSAPSQPYSSFYPPPSPPPLGPPFSVGGGMLGVILKIRTVDISGPRAGEG